MDDTVRSCGSIAHSLAKGHRAFFEPETGSQATIERELERFQGAAKAPGVEV